MKIDLSKLPEGTKWIVIDEDGALTIAAYASEPELDSLYALCSDDGFIGFIEDVHD